MSEFSNLLSKHIHNKNIKVYSLAQYCGLDRSNMYKVINGKRKPTSLDMVDRMSHFMHLLPSEDRDLKEAYQISLIGHENYYRRKSVLDFLQSFHLSGPSLPSANYMAGGDILSNDITALNSIQEINQALMHIIFSERNKENGHIRMLIQPDYEFLMDILTTLTCQSENTYIEHILCFNNSPDSIHSKTNYNLYCLQKILPLYGNYYQYDCYYYYDNIISKTGTFNLFPYIIITSQYACLLTHDQECGFVTSVPDLIKMFCEMFDTYRKHSSPLFRQIDDAFSHLQCIREQCHIGEAVFSFQMTPCMTSFLTPSLIEKHLVPDLPQREAFIDMLQNHIVTLKKYSLDSAHYIFSYDGLCLFAETGRIGEYPDSAYTKFDLSDRIYLIKQLLQACKTQNYRMLKKNIGNFSNNLYMFVSKSSGYLMFSSPADQVFTYLIIEESGLLSTFWDFFENMDEKMFYTKEETLMLIREIIKEYR